MKKSKVSQVITTRFNVGVLAVSSLVLVGGSFLPALRNVVLADSYDSQIQAIQQQNTSSQATVSTLQTQAASYQDAINQLQTQITALQSSIDINTAKQTSLQQQIVADQQEIDTERALLANDLKSMYVDGTPTTLEMLATSKDLSEFVDKQQYRSTVQNALQDTMTKITTLQTQVQTQKATVDQLLGEQTTQQAQLDSDRTAQANLLTYNETQQAAYTAQITANNAKVASLRAQQAAANKSLSSGGSVVAGDPNHGGYPSVWSNAAQDTLIDNWGMYNRECVSYTAWKVYQTYGYMPYWGGSGNAIQWIGDARAAGIQTSSTPKAESVAIWNVGYYGHAMWVESVNSDGSLWVSQYNYDYHGTYSEMRVSASMAASLTYIYFK